jgi:HAD superfamily hydrolase (TIGR01509 family)
VAIFGIERGAERGLTRFAAVIFDMDGLLLDTERIAFETFVLACQHFELGDQAAVFYRCLGTNQARGHEVLREGLGGRVDPVTFGGVWESHYVAATSTRPVPLKPGVKQLLADLDQLGVPAAVATSTSSERAAKKLDAAGLGRHFAAVVGGDQVEHSKPHPAIYLRAADVLGVDPARCLALEDSDNGVRAAVSAGMTVIQIPDLVPPSPELLALGHTVLESLDQVAAFAFGATQR